MIILQKLILIIICNLMYLFNSTYAIHFNNHEVATNNMNQKYVQSQNYNDLSTDNEDIDYSSIKISNGYGKLKEVGIVVTKGVIGNFEINTTLRCITEAELKEFIEQNKDIFSTEHFIKIKEHPSYINEGLGADLLCGIIGTKFGDGTWEYYKNTYRDVVKTNQKKFIKALHGINTSNLSISCNASIIGTSFIPVKTYCLVRFTKLEFSDGKKLLILNNKPIIMQENGTTEGIKVLSISNLIF